MTGKIIGTGSFIPGFVMTNEGLAEFVDTNDEWIRERTGIARRHFVKNGETTVMLAAEAGRRALENAGIGKEEVDMVIVTSATPTNFSPCTACDVQNLLELPNAVCFDMNAACSGFVFGIITAQAYIQTGMKKTILLIGAESLSNVLNFEDRTSCILFGDGAGAVVIQAQEEGTFQSMMASDGTKGWALTGASRNKIECPPMEETYIQMDGKAIFQFAIKRVPEALKQLSEQVGVSLDDIDLFVMHQANGRIIEAVARKVKQPIEKFPMDIEEYGNTSSASVGILLDELNRAGKLKKGMKLMLCGFGAGLSWGAAYMIWDE